MYKNCVCLSWNQCVSQNQHSAVMKKKQQFMDIANKHIIDLEKSRVEGSAVYSPLIKSVEIKVQGLQEGVDLSYDSLIASEPKFSYWLICKMQGRISSVESEPMENELKEYFQQLLQENL